ncbi:MAG: hypothetical protein ACLSEV_01880 [Coprococcus sp.]
MPGIRVALKRRGVAEVHTHRIEIRGVCMDTDRHEVTVCGEIVELTNREFESAQDAHGKQGHRYGQGKAAECGVRI